MMKLEQIPFSFFDDQGVDLSNYSAGDLVLESAKIPEGFTGIVKDNDTIFDSAGGSVDYFIRYASGQETKFRKAVSTDDSGFVNKLLKEGDRILIKLNSTGTGKLDVIWHGEIRQVRELAESNPLEEFDEDDL